MTKKGGGVRKARKQNRSLDSAVNGSGTQVLSEPQSNWLTATEAAAYLKIKPHTLTAWARAGKARGFILSGTKRVTWRFLKSDLDAMLSLPSVLVANSEDA